MAALLTDDFGIVVRILQLAMADLWFLVPSRTLEVISSAADILLEIGERIQITRIGELPVAIPGDDIVQPILVG